MLTHQVKFIFRISLPVGQKPPQANISYLMVGTEVKDKKRFFYLFKGEVEIDRMMRGVGFCGLRNKGRVGQIVKIKNKKAKLRFRPFDFAQGKIFGDVDFISMGKVSILRFTCPRERGTWHRATGVIGVGRVAISPRMRIIMIITLIPTRLVWIRVIPAVVIVVNMIWILRIERLGC